MSRSVSSTSTRSSIGNGGVSDRGQYLDVGGGDLDLAGRRGLRFTVPSGAPAPRRSRARPTRAFTSDAAAWASGASSGWATTCTMPSRSRRSKNTTPPWSRVAAPPSPSGRRSSPASTGPQVAAHVRPAAGQALASAAHRAHPRGRSIHVQHLVGDSPERSSPSRMRRNVTVPLRSPGRPTITAKRAPRRSAVRSWAFSGRSPNDGRHRSLAAGPRSVASQRARVRDRPLPPRRRSTQAADPAGRGLGRAPSRRRAPAGSARCRRRSRPPASPVRRATSASPS